MSKAQLYDYSHPISQLLVANADEISLYYSSIISLNIINWVTFSVQFMKKRFEKQMKINKKCELT